MRRKENRKRQIVAWSVISSLILAYAGVVPKMEVKAADIYIDGNISEWENIPQQATQDASVPVWKVVQDEEYLYFCGQDKNGTDWYAPLTQQTVIFDYANNGAQGTNGFKAQIGLSISGDANGEKNPIRVIDYWGSPVEGASAVYQKTAGTSMEANMERVYEWSVPKSFLADTDFSIQFCGTKMNAAEIPQVSDGAGEESGSGSEGETEENPGKEEEAGNTNPSYQGIVIDGSFLDWDAIQKTPANDPQGIVEEVAMVWDKDTIYLYFMAKGNEDGTGNWNSVTWSGPNSNGQFAITTDLGKTLMIQLKDNNGVPAVAGVEGAKAAVNKQEWVGAPHKWEVSIPANQLPAYKETIHFGYYQQEAMIKDVTNLWQDSDSEDKEFQGIVIDGLYGDWTYYPHQLIQYATPGTGNGKPDGEGAVYMTDATLFAHVKTEMETHRQQGGGDFTKGINIRLNGKDEYTFLPRMIAVDTQGNINYNPQLSNLSQGTYEFYITDTQGWGSATNISQLESQGDALYGHAYLTIGASADDMEFEIDLSKLAKKFGMEEDEIHKTEVRWQQIGSEWVTTAGTSTGAWTGLLVCFAAVGIAAIVQKNRKKTVK